MSCEGESPADVENIGPVSYYPRQGFPGYFFPYENSEGYLSPLVAVQFTRPQRKYEKRILGLKSLIAEPKHIPKGLTNSLLKSGKIILNLGNKNKILLS